MISIIIPVYNGEKYLQRCLDSIQHQTYTDFEVIVVDDGSTDGSGEISDNMAKTDSRFHVIHQKNAGVSEARNAGLLQAKGDVTFIDADDYVGSDYLEKLIKGLAYPEVDISYCIWRDEYEGKNRTAESYPQNRGGQQDTIIDSQDYDWNGKLEHPIVWSAIFRKEILNGLAFDKRFYVGEDSLFFAQCVKKARKLYFVHDTVYNYVHYQESAYHGKFDSRKVTEIYAWEEICKLYRGTSAENMVKVALAKRIKKFCCTYCSEHAFSDSDCLKELIVKYHGIQNVYFKELIKTRKYKELVTGISFGILPRLYLKLNETKKFIKTCK